MTFAPTPAQELVTTMLFLVDPRTDEDSAITSIEAMDSDTLKELLTMISSWTAGELEARAQRLEISIVALMDLIAGRLREAADQVDRFDHEGGMFL